MGDVKKRFTDFIPVTKDDMTATNEKNREPTKRVHPRLPVRVLLRDRLMLPFLASNLLQRQADGYVEVGKRLQLHYLEFLQFLFDISDSCIEFGEFIDAFLILCQRVSLLL
jgi:hypothetical protein